MRLLILVAVISALSVAGCSHSRNRRLIVIDGWWDDNYAQSVCDFAASATIEYGLLRCIEQPSAMAKRLESDFLTEFQQNSQCSGLSIYRGFSDPEKITKEQARKAGDAGWSLSFDASLSSDTGFVDRATSTWQIIDSDTRKKFGEGNLGNIHEAASSVCRMVKGVGGTVE